MKRFVSILALLLCVVPALAANQVVNEVRGPWVLYKATTRVATAATLEACEQLAIPLNPPRKTWSCKNTVTFETVKVILPPVPVDATCADNGWVNTGPPSMCMNSQQTQLQTRTWTTLTPPSNGGKACPTVETRTITEACTGPTPPMTGGPYIDPAKIPAPAPGYPNVRVQTSTQVANATDGSGAFRLVCNRSHYLPDDPIVYPGQPGASHMHMFFGNTGLKASTTPANIDTGNGTCAGGIATHSAAWIPAIVDTVSHAPVEPTFTIIYYKTGYHDVANIKPIPKNLRMIAGQLSTNAAPTPDWKWTQYAYFWCDKPAHVNSETIPACAPGATLFVIIQFPPCWDGVNLDSPNHRSHMSYTTPSGCPASHPVEIPTISINVEIVVPPGADTTKWRLASDMYSSDILAGYSLHGDYWAAWMDSIQAGWMSGCINVALDCHAYLLNSDVNGDGTKDEVF